MQAFFLTKKTQTTSILLHQDNVCKYTTFVVSGLLRSYTVDDEGEEKTYEDKDDIYNNTNHTQERASLCRMEDTKG